MADIPWDLRRRALKDSIRHDTRVKEAIRQNLKELIAEENIITAEGKKLVKIPLRYLDQYRFRFGQLGSGAGQGKGDVGEVIARDGERSEGIEQPGNQPGEQVYEAEISLEELTRMMLEDLALPWLEDKEAQQITTHTYNFDDVRRKGSMANLDKKRTLLENLKRHAADRRPKVGTFHDADLRFKVWSLREEHHSNAAVYLLMDRSGSMTTEKKYIAKSFFFWLVRFLKLKYQTVEMVFIAHDTEAQIVPEQDFFTISNSGGTICSSAYRVALEHIQQHHPQMRWNNYVFHFSDGDNWHDDNARCNTLVRQLLDHTTMVGYGEIRYQDEASFYGGAYAYNSPWSTLHQELSTNTHQRFMTVAIKQKADVYRALQTFLARREAGGTGSPERGNAALRTG
jgi:sporulation protein YhbH